MTATSAPIRLPSKGSSRGCVGGRQGADGSRAGRRATNAEGLHELLVLVGLLIRLHLRPARAAALDGPLRVRAAIVSRVNDRAFVSGAMHAHKAVVCLNHIPTGIALACVPRDIDEILGAMLENAFVWCRGKIAIGDPSRTRSSRRFPCRARKPAIRIVYSRSS